jgi:hypothetical protein
VVVHAFNHSTWEAEAGGFLSLRPAWSTKRVPGQPGLHRETLSQKKKKKKKQERKKERERERERERMNSGLLSYFSTFNKRALLETSSMISFLLARLYSGL